MRYKSYVGPKMPPKRHYEVGESSNSRAITEEAKARRQAYLQMWRNAWNMNSSDEMNPPPPQMIDEPHQADAPVLPDLGKLQDPDEGVESDGEEDYIMTSAGEKVQFKWGRCIGTGPDPEEEEEEEEEDPEEGDLEEDPEEAPMREQHMDTEESEEDPEENFEGEIEEEEEAESVGEDIEEELEPMESSEDEEPWEIHSDDDEILDEDVDEGNEDEPVAIEREPDEWELNDLEYKGFPSDDDLY